MCSTPYIFFIPFYYYQYCIPAYYIHELLFSTNSYLFYGVESQIIIIYQYNARVSALCLQV